MKKRLLFVKLTWAPQNGPREPGARRAARGPLRVHPENPRSFTDGSGRAVYLTGSHTWSSLVDMGPEDPPPRFDFTAYLDWLQRYGHNFVRLWTWELATWDTSRNGPALRKEKVHTAAPQPWLRAGPGRALDGKPRFDLERFDPEYFRRLRARVAAAAPAERSGQGPEYRFKSPFEGDALLRVTTRTVRK